MGIVPLLLCIFAQIFFPGRLLVFAVVVIIQVGVAFGLGLILAP